MWSKADALATQMREVLKVHPWVKIICLASMRELRIVKTTLLGNPRLELSTVIVEVQIPRR